MKIIFFIGQLGLGGGERQLYLLLRGIDRKKIDPIVVCFNVEGNYWGEFISSLDVPVIYLHSRSPLLRMIFLRKLLIRLTPDIGISWDIQTNPYLALLNKIYRFRKTFGGVRCNLFKEGRSDFQRFIRTVWLNNFIVNSQQGVASLTKIGKLNSEILHNAVEVISDKNKNTLCELLGVTDDVPIILFTGGLKKVKNPGMLLNAFIRINPNARLVFIGDGPLKSELEMKAKASIAHSKIHFLGRIENANQLMSGADIFCLTSSTEGMPNVLLEASAAGLAVITSDVGGARDVVQERVTGFIFSPEDELGLVNHLLHLLEDPGLRKQMGEAGAERMRNYFSEKSMAETFEKIVSR